MTRTPGEIALAHQMNMKRILYLPIIFALFLTPGLAQNADGVLDTSSGFPVQIILNKVVQAPALTHRNIFILVEAQYFTADNIKKLFTGLPAKSFFMLS